MTPSSAKKNKESSHLSGFGFKKAGEERDPEHPTAEEKKDETQKEDDPKNRKVVWSAEKRSFNESVAR